MTPGLEFTRRRATAGGTGGQAVDLGEIRRSEEAISVLAARGAAGPAWGAAGPDLTHDPALALLTALVADVDTPWPAQARAAWPGRAADQRAGAWQALTTPSRGAAAWLRAAVAGGVMAGLASMTSLIATSMLARLARGPARGGRRGQRPARPRRTR